MTLSFVIAVFAFQFVLYTLVVSFVIQIMQKASIGFDRAKQNEKELKKEVNSLQKRAERAEKESVQHAQSLKDVWEEAERLKGENIELKRRAKETERDLCQQLVAAKARAEAKYDRAVIGVMANYRAQMPAMKDATNWTHCLAKVGVPKDFPLWTDMELSSQMEALAAQAQLDTQNQLELPPN